MALVAVFSGSVVKFKRALKTVLSQAVHEDTVHLSMATLSGKSLLCDRLHEKDRRGNLISLLRQHKIKSLNVDQL